MVCLMNSFLAIVNKVFHLTECSVCYVDNANELMCPNCGTDNTISYINITPGATYSYTNGALTEDP